MSAVQVEREVGERSGWRAVAMPTEHGGWGLTLEPVLLGLLVAWSAAGLLLGAAAFLAFLVRTPLKLVAVDRRRGRWLDRSGLALRLAIVELVVLAAAIVAVVMMAGWTWLVPVAAAVPLIVTELAFDVRSRSRRLVPELCGAVGISAVAASIVLAAGRDAGLAVGVWLVLAARGIGAIPFVRVQIRRLRHGAGPVWQSDLASVLSVMVAAAAPTFADRRVMAGFVGVAFLAVVHTVWVRRPAIPAKQVGLRQMVAGLALVAVTAAGVLW